MTAGVKQLRELTGAPMVDCKAALVAAGSGGMDAAIDYLRKRGLAAAGRKAGRAAAQGLVSVAVSSSGDHAAIVEVRVGGSSARAWQACARARAGVGRHA